MAPKHIAAAALGATLLLGPLVETSFAQTTTGAGAGGNQTTADRSDDDDFDWGWLGLLGLGGLAGLMRRNDHTRRPGSGVTTP
jgi:hypothetical protein